MYDDPPVNINEINKVFEKYCVREELTELKLQERKVKEYYLFSESIRRELSKARPKYAKKRHDLILYGGGCCFLATFSALVLPSPYNWIMAAGCIGPIAINIIKRRKWTYLSTHS